MIKRKLSSKILQLAQKFPVLMLNGPRQSGKTTLLKELFPDYHYYNMESLDVRTMAEEDPRGFLLQNKDQGVFIDEIQKVPVLFSYLQQIVDESGQMGKFILSGSQNYLLMQSVTQSLAGRVAVLQLLPFSYREIEPKVNVLDIDKILFKGFYPVIHDREMEPVDYFPSYIQTYVERDVRSLKNIGDLSLFNKFLRICAGRIGQEVNYQTMANDLGINYKTIQSWISILETSFILFMLPPFYNNYNKRVIKHPKLYFNDTALALSLLGLTHSEQLSTYYGRGALFENLIIAETRKNFLNDGLSAPLYFWRENNGTEIDLIIESGGTLKAIEIKSGMTINKDFFKGLTKFTQYAGLEKENCKLIYGGEESYSSKIAEVQGWREYLYPWSDCNIPRSTE